MARAFEKEHVQEQEVLLQNIETIDISNSCFSKVYLTAWRNRNSCCPDCLAIATSNTDTFCKNGLSIHYRSSHPRKEFKENEAGARRYRFTSGICSKRDVQQLTNTV